MCKSRASSFANVSRKISGRLPYSVRQPTRGEYKGDTLSGGRRTNQIGQIVPRVIKLQKLAPCNLKAADSETETNLILSLPQVLFSTF